MRLFVALDLPGPVKDHLVAVTRKMEPHVPGARWVPRENLHLTLSFIGEVPDERLAPISDAVGGATAGLVDFATHLDGLGAFPSWRRARVLWAGLSDPAGGIAGVAEAVAEALEPLGVAREKRAFVPHLTIARVGAPRPVDPPAVSLDPVPFAVERVTLFRSRLRRPAPVYEPIATFPFRREAAGPRDR